MAGSAKKLTKYQLQVINWITKGSGLLGIFGSIAFFLLFSQSPPHLHSPNARLVFALGLVDLWDAVFKFLGRLLADQGSRTFGCHLQAVLMQVCDGVGVALTFCLGYNLLYLIYFRGDVQVVRRREMSTLVLCIAIPSIVAFMPYWIAGDKFYGDSDLWCWISSKYAMWRLYLLYIPAWITFFFCVTVLILISRRMATWQRELADAGYKDKHIELNPEFVIELQELVGYLVVFILLWIPGSVNRIKYVVSGGEQIFGLYAWQAVTSPTHGFANFLPFLFSWHQLRKLEREESTHRQGPVKQKGEEDPDYPPCNLEDDVPFGSIGRIRSSSTLPRNSGSLLRTILPVPNHE